ncbi:MAG: DUF4058 family protein [Cyanobacteria bacterium SBLK]|nr:DUF4058 family protein [Cyanobacteria bacterium SBLK]
MPSPFPGIDPYLEHPNFWSEVHNFLIVAIAHSLIPQVRPKYRVAIEKRIDEVSDRNGSDSLLVGIPDVGIQRYKGNRNLLEMEDETRDETRAITVTLPVPQHIKQSYLEIRDLASQEVIAAIEILSPVNKRNREGREIYLQKRRRILGSLTHLIEIDFLRGGQPMPIVNDRDRFDYRVLIARGDRRPQASLYGFNLRDSLPCISIPLQSTDREPILDLQSLFDEVYDRGGYDYVIDYSQNPVPALSETDLDWAIALLERVGLRS